MARAPGARRRRGLTAAAVTVTVTAVFTAAWSAGGFSAEGVAQQFSPPTTLPVPQTVSPSSPTPSTGPPSLPGPAGPVHTPVPLPPDAAREWALNALEAGKLWEHSEGQGITVAVVDTGIAGDLPDLQSAVSGGSQNVDNSPDSHGTEIAGVIAGRGRSTVTGLAPLAQVMNVQVTSDEHDVTAREIANGINEAVQRGAQVINVSLEVPHDQTDPRTKKGYIQEAVTSAWNSHHLVVASVGDTRADSYPEAADDVIAVAAASKDPGHQPLTRLTKRQGPHDVYAPGVGVYSVTKSGQSVYLSGSDYAAGYVSATAALLWAADEDLPQQSLDQFRREVIRDSSLERPGFLDPLATLRTTPYRTFPPVGSGSVTASPTAAESSESPGSGGTTPADGGGGPSSGSHHHGDASGASSRFYSHQLSFYLPAGVAVLGGAVLTADYYRRRRRTVPGADFDMDTDYQG